MEMASTNRTNLHRRIAVDGREEASEFANTFDSRILWANSAQFLM